MLGKRKAESQLTPDSENQDTATPRFSDTVEDYVSLPSRSNGLSFFRPWPALFRSVIGRVFLFH